MLRLLTYRIVNGYSRWEEGKKEGRENERKEGRKRKEGQKKERVGRRKEESQKAVK